MEQTTPAPGKGLFTWMERHRLTITLALALVALLGYVLFTWQQVTLRGLFDTVGCDFRSYYASGQIWRERGAAAIYDLSVQEAYQKPLYDRFARYVEGDSIPFFVLPTPYLPVFILPFLLLSFIPPLPAFIIWEALNTLAILGYLLLWARRLNLKSRERLVLVIALFLSAPVYHNLFLGQTNLFLLIGVGETLYHLIHKRDLRAGLWLTLVSIKPHLLILPVVLMVALRRWRFLTGFATGVAVIGLTTLLLSGFEGMLNLVRVLSGYNPILRIGGITWLNLIDTLEILGLQRSGALCIGGAMALVILLAWTAILRQGLGHADAEWLWPEIFLITLATQMFVAFHGHVYMAMAMEVPWMLYLQRHRDGLSFLVFIFWGLLPGIILAVVALRSLGNAAFLLSMTVIMAHILIILVVERVGFSGTARYKQEIER